MTEDEMVGWHHQLNGHKSEQTLGDGEGQGSLVCYSPQGCKELDSAQQLNNNMVQGLFFFFEHVVRIEQEAFVTITTVIIPGDSTAATLYFQVPKTL